MDKILTTERDYIDWGVPDADDEDIQKYIPDARPISAVSTGRYTLTSDDGDSGKLTFQKIYKEPTAKDRDALLSLPEDLIAQQLSVLEFDVFLRIEPRDFLQHIWSRRRKGRHANRVAASISHFNFISSWCVNTILSFQLNNYPPPLFPFFKKLFIQLNVYNIQGNFVHPGVQKSQSPVQSPCKIHARRPCPPLTQQL